MTPVTGADSVKSKSKDLRHGWSLPQAAIAWLLGHSQSMLPIPGTSREDHLEQLVAAAAFVRSD